MGIGVDIDGAVMMTNVFSHDRRTVGRILAMKDQCGSGLRRVEKLTGKPIFIIVINGTINVATFILIFEAAINNHNIVELATELSIEKFQEGVFGDARQTVRPILRCKVRKLGLRSGFDVTDGLEGL
jgi:hypothetical protein